MSEQLFVVALLVGALLAIALILLGLRSVLRRKRAIKSPRQGTIILETAPGSPDARVPAAYFMFASDGLSPDAIRNAHRKYGRVMVGFDAGNKDEPSFKAQLQAAKEVGAELEIYVEGPGGPTGDAWDPGELERIKANARAFGVDTAKSHEEWLADWNAGPWKKYTFQQLQDFCQKGFTAAEIDNLYRGVKPGAAALIDFYKEYGEAQKQGLLPRLIMKNIDAEDMAEVVRAVQNGVLARSMFSEFHISERDSGDRAKQASLSAKIGIRTLMSDNTYKYDAFGEFGLEQEFAEAMAIAPATAPNAAA